MWCSVHALAIMWCLYANHIAFIIPKSFIKMLVISVLSCLARIICLSSLTHISERPWRYVNTDALSVLLPNAVLCVWDVSVAWQINKFKSVVFLELVWQDTTQDFVWLYSFICGLGGLPWKTLKFDVWKNAPRPVPRWVATYCPLQLNLGSTFLRITK